MANEKHVNRNVGPNQVAEKPKDFKLAIKKLFKYLKGYRAMILVAIILAVVSSTLSIVGPNKLRDLTDKISAGLIINKDNLTSLTETIQGDLTEEKISSVSKNILNVNLNSDVITKIYTSSLSEEDKASFKEFLTSDKSMMLVNLAKLPESIQTILLPDSTYSNIDISTSDKIDFLNALTNMSSDTNKTAIFATIPDNIKLLFFSDSTIDGVTISPSDKVIFLNTMSSIDESNHDELYAKLDTLPDSIQTIIKPTMDLDGIKTIGLFLLVLYLTSAIFNYIENIIMVVMSNNFAKELRSKISIKINKLPLKYFDSHSYGDILSRVTNDVDTINTSMQQSLGSLVGAIALFIGSIIMMFKSSPIMAITAILSSLFGFIFMFLILGKSQKYFTARQVELGKLNGHIEEVYSSHNVVKAYNGEEEASKTFNKYNQSVYECNRKSQFLSGLMPPLMSFIGNFSYVAICIVGAVLVIKGQITFGVIVAFIVYVRLFTSPLSQIAQGMTQLQTATASSERVFEFIEEKEIPEENNKKVLDKNKVKGNIEFNHVKFGYDSNKTIIKDFNCKVKPGEKIAIVGPTGAGKTTIVNLLMKFYEVNSGNINIDGISLNDLTRENVHDLFVMVLQDTWLFNGTIRDNIKFNREDITDEEIWKALEVVGVSHFVKSLSKTLDYVMGDNDSISAGQKQLLTIARGMIKKAPFLILDEATSSVDTRTEELVQKAMDKLTHGKTSFIIAHRLSTIKNADLILVMKDGNIIEQGNHEELIKQKGFYYELYNSQFQD